MSFGADVAKFNTKVKKRFIVLKQRSALALFTNIIMSTPVLTGALRNNWAFNMGSPSDAVLLGTDKSGATAISRSVSGLQTVDLFTTFYFTNNLLYVIPIEYDDWSAQARGGVVRPNVLRWDAIVQSVAKGLR